MLSSCFAGLHGLDETGGAEVERAVRAELDPTPAPHPYPYPYPYPNPNPDPNQVRAALDSPEAYVLKPQVPWR